MAPYARIETIGNRSVIARRRNGLPIVVASKNRIGRIRRAVKRCFIISGGAPILTRQVLESAYCRLRRFTTWHYLAARRALRQEAVIVARNRLVAVGPVYGAKTAGLLPACCQVMSWGRINSVVIGSLRTRPTD
jgi:hypothetical protein